MRILYGVCGEGFGHSSRAKTIIEHLRKKRHHILILTYGQAYPILKPIAKAIKIKGIHLIFKKNKLSLSKTLIQSITFLSSNIKNFNKIKKEIKKFKPQICISDMEPLVPIIAHQHELPLISIDNQHRLTHLKLKVPKKYKKSYYLAKFTVKQCISKADAFIILSFTKQQSLASNAFIVSPILRNEIIKTKPKNRNFMLVYLTKPDSKLIQTRKSINEKCIIYGYNKSVKEGNLVFKPTGKQFVKDLAKSKAVIATAGFTLISESLYLKKPYFAIPRKGQFEQTLNALFLKESGLGTFSENPTQIQIEKFLQDLPRYREKLKHHTLHPDEAVIILDKILKHIKPQIY